MEFSRKLDGFNKFPHLEMASAFLNKIEEEGGDGFIGAGDDHYEVVCTVLPDGYEDGDELEVNTCN